MLFISLDRNSSLSLTRQLYLFFRDAILSGTLKQGEKLPSSRELGKQLNIARNVVIESYEQLTAEGYVHSKRGSGTYVNEGTFFEKRAVSTILPKAEKKEDRKEADTICFRTGIPDLSCIPVKQWGKLYKEITLTVKPSHMDYQNSNGEYSLRCQLTDYLRRTRGVMTHPDNIFITNGAAQAFSLLSQTISHKEYALVENPLSYGLLHTLKSNKVTLQTISVDAWGMNTSMLPQEPPKFIFTTPSHQFPTGVVLPISRRIEMINYARNHDAYIVEDDYDSEFRFDGSPIPSMQSLDPSRVIYIGTFSKSLMPALRMGYMVLPDVLRTQIEMAKYVADIHSPILEQLTMAKFIEEGYLNLHIKKMKGIYLKRRNHLTNCLKQEFKDKVTLTGASTGMHLVASFKGITFDKMIMEKIKENHIQISSVNMHYLTKEQNQTPKCPYDSFLIFGYGNTNLITMEKGIKLLNTLLYPSKGGKSRGA